MPEKVNLSLAVDTYDRTQPLVDGRVRPDGIELTPFEYKSPERHRRMLKHTEFDICELSFGSYLAGVERDMPYTGIPVFPNRKFRHAYYFTNANAGIDEPADLEGKRVGIRRWQNTAAVWMRGIVSDYYDVDLSQIQWYVDDEDEIPVDIPDEFAVERIPDSTNINELLVEGDLDATMYPKRPAAFKDGSGAVERLFSDYKQEEMQYYQDTGMFPIMHIVVIRDELVEKHPWIPMNVRKAFEEAKQIALDELDHSTLPAREISLIWGQHAVEEQQAVVGDDPWPNNVEDNRAELESLISYARELGLMSEPIEPEDLFIESSLEDLPQYA